MVGMSTSGSGETGSLKNAMAPATTSPSESSVVATGRRIKGVERDIRDATEAVADQLLSGNASIQKPYNVTWYRHTLAANKGLENACFWGRCADEHLRSGLRCACDADMSGWPSQRR